MVILKAPINRSLQDHHIWINQSLIDHSKNCPTKEYFNPSLLTIQQYAMTAEKVMLTIYTDHQLSADME